MAHNFYAPTPDYNVLAYLYSTLAQDYSLLSKYGASKLAKSDNYGLFYI